ncbi:uncharacterized protein EI97DRAFT_432087 [Westerdykella ornata]|uniref:Uncharacterized protein n=1 Tax=Westerdykella ornata TaxID=318751 RepID=A0A6A6JSN8_WESOR|nr:uncharacterized protein EI97DRAFT_432087 [Westerdykella ornata]KAF2277999.1 hypothetical protein EI97DRAFT_432087 [Westerdykella ornata]
MPLKQGTGRLFCLSIITPGGLSHDGRAQSESAYRVPQYSRATSATPSSNVIPYPEIFLLVSILYDMNSNRQSSPLALLNVNLSAATVRGTLERCGPYRPPFQKLVGMLELVGMAALLLISRPVCGVAV